MEVRTRKLTVMAMLTAISVLLVWLVHLPIIPAAPFLEYDPADIPVLIGAFAFGPRPASFSRSRPPSCRD